MKRESESQGAGVAEIAEDNLKEPGLPVSKWSEPNLQLVYLCWTYRLYPAKLWANTRVPNPRLVACCFGRVARGGNGGGVCKCTPLMVQICSSFKLRSGTK